MSTTLEDTIDRAAAAPDFVEAEVRYVVDDGTPPYRYIDWPEMQDKDHPPAYEPRRVKIRNGRTSGETFALATHGFTLVERPTKMRDFYDEEEVLRVYHPETEALIKAESGAKRVIVFDHTVRTADKSRLAERWVRETVHAVHNDYTERSAPQRGARLLAARRGGRGAQGPLRDRTDMAVGRAPGRVRAARDVRRQVDPRNRLHPL